MTDVSYKDVAKNVCVELLKPNVNWLETYNGYVDNLGEYKLIRDKLPPHFTDVFRLYSSINNVNQGKKLLSVRFFGQQVAELKIEKNGEYTLAPSSKIKSEEKYYFDFNVELAKRIEKTQDMKDFLSHFKNKKEELLKLDFDEIEKNFKSPEHIWESTLLKEFSKTTRTDKNMINIQPIKICGKYDFQMPTPLSASDHNNIRLAEGNGHGGGIDILSKIRSGNKSQIITMEVKDQTKTDEPPKEVMKQAVAYATFLYLLMLKSEEWCKFFTSEDRVKWLNKENPREIVACIVMPYPTEQNGEFFEKICNLEKEEINLKDIISEACDELASKGIQVQDIISEVRPNDKILLRTLYFEKGKTENGNDLAVKFVKGNWEHLKYSKDYSE